ncbi:STAS domain-containing protein [Streptomyces sp. NPDC007206]|uniref:STAS domain-containing protein n=1 Tax=Streptomyces sp. NPDC007206 TaxID=3154317 RepID=UPI003411D8AD
MDSRTVVAVAGEVDHLTAAGLDDALQAAVISGATHIEADFSRVAFCDCAGLNVLLAAHNRCRQAGVRFAVSGPLSPVVERLLQVGGTGPVLLRESDPVDGSARSV